MDVDAVALRSFGPVFHRSVLTRGRYHKPDIQNIEIRFFLNHLYYYIKFMWFTDIVSIFPENNKFTYFCVPPKKK